MIFSIEGHIDLIIKDEKIATRRPTDKYKIGNLYAIQPKRNAKGISDGKIYIVNKDREWKPNFSDLPKDDDLGRRWRTIQAGYPIRKHNAIMEGNYTPEAYEKLYEEMYPNWEERWAYIFCFMSKKDLEEVEEAKKKEREWTKYLKKEGLKNDKK